MRKILSVSILIFLSLVSYPQKPQVLKDSTTNFTYVLDTSKTFISSFDGDGNILWKIDPYKNSNTERNMFKKTKIHSMEFGQNPGYGRFESKKGEKVIWIYYGFQWDYIDLKTGVYHIIGQD